MEERSLRRRETVEQETHGIFQPLQPKRKSPQKSQVKVLTTSLHMALRSPKRPSILANDTGITDGVIAQDVPEASISQGWKPWIWQGMSR